MQQSNSFCLAVNPPPFDKGGKFSARQGIVVLLQWLWEWQGLVQREGQARQGCLMRVCPRALQGRKALGHTQTLALRKARVIVRFWKAWCEARGGVTIPPVVARIFSGDSTSPLTREARVLVRGEGWCGFGGVMWVLLKHYCFTTGH